MKIKKQITARTVTVIVSTVLLVLACVGMTVAFIIDKTDPITNIFQPSTVSCEVNEKNWTDGDTVKEEVVVVNTGDTDAFIRCAIVINWQNDAGEVLGTAPVENTDYSLKLNLKNWTPGSDGYYYHKSEVSPEQTTEVLVRSCEVLAAAPKDGYTLSVEILASAIQSSPETAVMDAWGATVSNGVLTPN